jgi:MFS superfamily sulfate permease-like transporter
VAEVLSTRQDWFSNVRNDLLAGLVVALALIPKAIAFSSLIFMAQLPELTGANATWQVYALVTV